MPACSDRDWNMNVILPNGTLVARPVFTNITISGRDISGDVHLPLNNRISGLVGECVPLASDPNIAAAHFRFRLRDASGEIGMLMSGVVFFRPSATEATFSGSWIAHTPGTGTPTADNLITEAGFILPGSGDTGSGTGSTT
jgi:hypothetical protein